MEDEQQSRLTKALWDDPEWFQRGSCNALDETRKKQLFDPASPSGDRHSPRAKLICGYCPVFDLCDASWKRNEQGLPASRRFYIWAGKTPMERAIEDLGEEKARKRKRA